MARLSGDRRCPDHAMGLPELANSPDQDTGADILKAAMGAMLPALSRAGTMLVAAGTTSSWGSARRIAAEEVKERPCGAP